MLWTPAEVSRIAHTARSQRLKRLPELSFSHGEPQFLEDLDHTPVASMIDFGYAGRGLAFLAKEPIDEQTKGYNRYCPDSG